jgi:hypothetical protein
VDCSVWVLSNIGTILELKVCKVHKVCKVLGKANGIRQKKELRSWKLEVGK